MTDSLRLMWIAGLVWFLRRQVRPRRVARVPTISIMLIALGLAQCTLFLEHHSLGAAGAGVLIGSFAVGLGLAVIRAFSIRLWVNAGAVWRRGTWLTLVLWLAALGSHLGSDRPVEDRGRPAGASSATILLYLGASLFVQTLVVRHRAQKLLNASAS